MDDFNVYFTLIICDSEIFSEFVENHGITIIFLLKFADPARKSGWIEIMTGISTLYNVGSRSQERVDRNFFNVEILAPDIDPARKSGWIEIYKCLEEEKSIRSRSQERVDRNFISVMK